MAGRRSGFDIPAFVTLIGVVVFAMGLLAMVLAAPVSDAVRWTLLGAWLACVGLVLTSATSGRGR